MKKRIIDWKMLVCVLLFGAVFTSCEREENLIKSDEEVATDLKEPPFKNYLVISGDSKKATDNYLKSAEGLKILSSIPELGISVVEASTLKAVRAAENDNITIIPNYEIKWIPTRTSSIESDDVTVGEKETFRQRLWGLDVISAPAAWNNGYLGNKATVFVLDSGIDAEHPDLAPNINTQKSESFVEGEDWNIQPGFYFNHGTHVAGTIGAINNDFGVLGVAPRTEIVAIKVLSEYTGRGSVNSIAAGLVHAANNEADVVNMSLGSIINKNGWLIDADGEKFKIPAKFVQEYIQFYQSAVDYAYNNGVTIIASAGNSSINADGDASSIKLPAGLNNVISVSATAPEGYLAFPDPNFDKPASYTNYGVSLVDIAAPGGDFDVKYTSGDIYPFDLIWSTISNGWGYSAGTSMAAPHVAGVAALIISKNGGKMNPREVAKQLEKTADKVDGNGQSIFYGHGRVNAFRAVTE